MNSLYERLDKTEKLKDRIKIILDYLESKDISQYIPEGSSLSEEVKVPFEEGKISLPLVVGYKYFRDEPYCQNKCPFYILGIVCTSQSVELLIIEPDEDDIGCLPRNWVEEPSDLIKILKN